MKFRKQEGVDFEMYTKKSNRLFYTGVIVLGVIVAVGIISLIELA